MIFVPIQAQYLMGSGSWRSSGLLGTMNIQLTTEFVCQDICSFGFTFSREDFCHLLAKKYFFVLSDCNYGEKQHHWRVSGDENDILC